MVIGAALLGLIGMWLAVLLPAASPDGREALVGPVAAAPSASPTGEVDDDLVTPSAAPSSSAPSPASASSAAPSLTAKPSTAPSASPRSSSVTAAAPRTPARSPARPVPTTAKASPGVVATTAPKPREAATAAPYVFAPKATASGQAPTADMRFSDLSLSSGQRVSAVFTMDAPGSVEFDVNTASSSAASGEYPTKALLACLEFVGQSPCRPVATPQPAYWAVAAADVAKHTRYRVRILATADSSLLARVRVGWRGPRALSVEGLRLPGGCQASVGKGYVPGCGLKYKISVPRAVTFTTTTTTATPGLQLSLKNTVTNAKAYSGLLTSPQRVSIPAAGEWSGHLYPSDGRRVAILAFSMDWN